MTLYYLQTVPGLITDTESAQASGLLKQLLDDAGLSPVESKLS